MLPIVLFLGASSGHYLFPPCECMYLKGRPVLLCFFSVSHKLLEKYITRLFLIHRNIYVIEALNTLSCFSFILLCFLQVFKSGTRQGQRMQPGMCRISPEVIMRFRWSNISVSMWIPTSKMQRSSARNCLQGQLQRWDTPNTFYSHNTVGSAYLSCLVAVFFFQKKVQKNFKKSKRSW